MEGVLVQSEQAGRQEKVQEQEQEEKQQQTQTAEGW